MRFHPHFRRRSRGKRILIRRITFSAPQFRDDGDHSIAGHRHQAVVNVTAHEVEVVLEGQRHVFHKPDVFADSATAVGDGAITAQMPGTVLTVNVEHGNVVRAGETLGVLEAMKMELALKAPFDGTVTQVGARAGEQVAIGAVLFVVEEA